VNGWQQVPIPRELAAAVPGAVGYQKDLRDGHLSVFVALEPPGWHMSISHRSNLVDVTGHYIPGRYPTWDEIHEARYQFIPDKVTMAMLLPPSGEYVNVHPTTFHLWQIRGENE
jgi:hypothetical protein